MRYQLGPFADIGLTPEGLSALIAEHDRSLAPMLDRLWSYYRNPLTATAAADAPGRWYRQSQEDGLAARRTSDESDGRRPVIENDIGWRIDALADFVAGKPIRIRSTAPDGALRERIDRALEAVFEGSGGMGMLRDATLLASVHGWVDFHLRADGLVDGDGLRGGSGDVASVVRAAGRLRIEVVEAPRAIPIVDPGDYRRLLGLVIRSTRREHRLRHGVDGRRAIGSWLRRGIPGAGAGAVWEEREVVEVVSASARQVYVDGELVVDAVNALGELPVAHVQNLSQPFRYGGLSDVEPLIPLQDELNTRLSDRAHRVTLQSFRMYLAKGLEATHGGGALPIGPGRVWATDNPEASIEAFGGDGHSPAEERHIEELREALDKVSGVSPVVLGVVRARLGHLSSVNALRITMLGILSKTERKRSMLTRGIETLSRLSLGALDRAGVLETREGDRGVRVEWPDPLPGAAEDDVRTALLKRELGVPADELREGLGHSVRDDAIG